VTAIDRGERRPAGSKKRTTVDEEDEEEGEDGRERKCR
jgi:hypothetical protein